DNEQANEKENANAIEENANVVEETERENEENEHVSATEENVNAIEENANENEENANENEENANVIEETERENEENEHVSTTTEENANENEENANAHDENEETNTPLNSAARGSHPQAAAPPSPGDGLRGRHELNDGEESDGQLTIEEDQIEKEGNEGQDNKEAMPYEFEKFKFGKMSSPAPSATSEVEVDVEKRDAADKADKDEVIEVSEEERQRLLKLNCHSRLGVSDASIDAAEMMCTEFPPSPKSAETAKFITQVLEKHFLFSSLDAKQLHKLAMVMSIEEFTQGSKLLVKGEASNHFYIVLDGEATMTIHEEDESRATMERLEKGSAFGEVGLLYETPSEVTVQSVTPLVCAVLERTTYKMIVSRAAEEKRQRYLSFLENVPFLKALTPQERLQLAEALKEDQFKKGDKVIRYGEKEDWLHFIVEGTVDIIGRDEKGEEEYVATSHAGECVGDLEFLYRHETVADVVATSPVVTTAKMSRLHFEKLFGSARELLDRKVKDDASYTYYRRRMGSASPPREDLTPPFDAPPAYLSNISVPLPL
ncbi:regulatory subunit of protein kinase a-like protein, partial [Trypanosoma conorhini]